VDPASPRKPGCMQIDPHLLSLYPVAVPPGSPSEPEEELPPLGQTADDSSPGGGSGQERAATPEATPELLAALGPTMGMVVAVVEAAAELLRGEPTPGQSVFPELPGPPAEPAPAPDVEFPAVSAATAPPPATASLPGSRESVEEGRVSEARAPRGGGAPAARPEAGPDGSSLDAEELTDEEQQEVQELKTRDRDVRQHEQAHVAAGGPYVRGGAQYEYTTGPDQRQYATGGEVSIDTSEIPDDPEATVRKAQVVYRAALAPAEPSSQDQRVASEAKQMESQGRQDITVERREETQAAQEERADEATEAEGVGGVTGEASGASDVGAAAAPDAGLDRAGEDVGQLVDLLA